ncbi:MAG: FAD-dependent oxidoreductase [Alphaproteobacteria bacterium]|nr:FAD-dependent oxidoreductase [Alphaproteobacteria bacterium]
MKANIAVLGAGMVGVCCALALLRRGASVTLLDRRGPGEETSYGNAGVIARSSLAPLNGPGLWKNLPRLATNRAPAMRYSLPYLLRDVRSLSAFLRNATPARFAETCRALDALIACSIEEHGRLRDEAGASARFSEDGWTYLHRTEAAYESGAGLRRLFDAYGVATEALDRDALREHEPSLAPIFAKALWIKDAWSVSDPGGLVKDYARLFADRGGVIRQAEIVRVGPHGDVWSLIDADGTRNEVDRLVVALGPWSKDFLAPLGLEIPMIYERGYHQEFSVAGNNRLRRPAYDIAGGYVLAPMAHGLRLTSGVELSRRDAPARSEQLNAAIRAAKQAFPLGAPLSETPWLGRRPTLPDSRPMIGPAPRRPGLWLAFGHQHIGFSTGPGTARLLADLMEGAPSPFDPGPFLPERYLS